MKNREEKEEKKEKKEKENEAKESTESTESKTGKTGNSNRQKKKQARWPVSKSRLGNCQHRAPLASFPSQPETQPASLASHPSTAPHRIQCGSQPCFSSLSSRVYRLWPCVQGPPSKGACQVSGLRAADTSYPFIALNINLLSNVSTPRSLSFPSSVLTSIHPSSLL